MTSFVCVTYKFLPFITHFIFSEIFFALDAEVVILSSSTRYKTIEIFMENFILPKLFLKFC